MNEFINQIELKYILLFLLLVLPLSSRIGKWIAVYSKGSNKFEMLDNIPASILGVHALILGFTFSMSISRFEDRRQLVIKEANAIGTAFLRAKTLVAPYGEQSQKVFLSYLENKVQYGRLVHSDQAMTDVLKAIDQNHTQLWNIAQQMVKTNRSTIESLYLSGLNEVIDVHSERVDALRNRLPSTVLVILFLTLVISLVSMGYANEIKNHYGRFWLIILSVLFGVVLTLIIDLDRPRRGMIQISQAPIQELYESVRAELSRSL